MNKLKPLCCVVCAAFLFLAGCAKQQQFKTLDQICIAIPEHGAPDTGHVMQAAEDVLVRMHFTIDKAEAESGYIKTRPLAGAQFFELWRKDNVGAFNATEANLHTIRRTVELNITQQGEQLCIDCDVNVQRLNMPQREAISTTRVYDIFSESKSSIQKLKLNPEQKKAMAWVDLGKDTKLSTVILKRLEEKLATKTVGTRTQKH